MERAPGARRLLGWGVHQSIDADGVGANLRSEYSWRNHPAADGERGCWCMECSCQCLQRVGQPLYWVLGEQKLKVVQLPSKRSCTDEAGTRFRTAPSSGRSGPVRRFVFEAYHDCEESICREDRSHLPRWSQPLSSTSRRSCWISW